MMSIQPSSRIPAVVRCALVSVAAMFGIVTSAFGAVTLQVERLNGVDTAIYSVPATSTPVAPARDHFVGWKVTVRNTGAGISSPVLFFGRTLVKDRQEKAVFDSYYFAAPNPDPRCRGARLLPTAVGCLIPALYPNTSVTFVVAYKTPKKVVNGVVDSEDPPTDYVNFRGTTFAFEDRDIFVDRDPTNRVALLSENDTQVSAFCPTDGCTVSTGTNFGIPTATDHYGITVTVGAGNRPTTVSISETFAVLGTATCTGESPPINVTECWTAELRIPSNNGETFNPPLILFLRQDLSTIKRVCSGGGGGDEETFFSSASSCYLVPVPIENIRVVYVAEGITTVVQNCTGAYGTALGEGQNECVRTRTSVPGTEGNPNGYYEFEILSDHNGGWGLR